MADIEHFDHLVHDLSDTERINLLKKLESISISTPEIDSENTESDSDREPVRYSLGIVERIILFIRSVVSNKNYHSIREDYYIEKLSRKLDKQFSGFFSLEMGDFYPEFGDELLKIIRSATVLRDIVNRATRDKTGFISFLSGLIEPEVQSRLVQETDPYKLERELETSDIIEIRRSVELNREKIFEEFSGDERDSVYRIIKGFYSLASFLSYPFEKLARILQSSLGVPRIVPVSDGAKLLENLLDRLYSFNILPENIVLEALYLYSHQEHSLDNQDSLTREIGEYAEVYNNMITSIRNFSSRIPLEKVLKVVNRDLDYTPTSINPGGEEWFSLYKRFWENRSLNLVNKFQKERKREELMITASAFLDEEEYALLNWYKTDAWGEDVPVTRDFSASFIVNFVQTKFLKRMNPFLKLIQNDGEFYKEQNMMEYNDSYGNIFPIQRKIQEIDDSLSPEGAYGRRIDEIRKTMDSGTMISHEITKTIESVEAELGKWILEFNLKADMLVNLLWGILFGEVGGRFDSLSNLSYIGGSNNDRVLQSLNNVYTEFKKFLDLLHQIQDLEK